MDVLEPDEERLVSQLRAGRPGAGAELIRLHYRERLSAAGSPDA